MKSYLSKMLLALICSLSFLGLANTAQAWHGGGFGLSINLGGPGYYYGPGYGYYPGYYYGPRYYYAPRSYYSRCGWVRGHWEYGYWVPGHRVCW